MDLEKLTEDLKAAIKEARRAAEAVEDGGACNLDTLFISTRKGVGLERAIEAAGAKSSWISSSMWRGYFVHFGALGQANKNTAAVEAACESMRRAGWDKFTVYYQAD